MTFHEAVRSMQEQIAARMEAECCALIGKGLDLAVVRGEPTVRKSGDDWHLGIELRFIPIIPGEWIPFACTVYEVSKYPTGAAS